MGNESSANQNVNFDKGAPHVGKPPAVRQKSNSLISPGQSTNSAHNSASTHSPSVGRRPAKLRIDEAVSNFSESRGDFGLSLAETLPLSPYQQQIISQTWPKIQARGSGGGNTSTIFHTLSKRNDAAKSIFQKSNILMGFQSLSEKRPADIKEHGKMTVELIDFAIGNFDVPAKETAVKCRQIGETHCGLATQGFHQSIWDSFGETMMEYVLRSEPLRKYRAEGTKAWGALISFLVDNMKNGYQAEIRRRGTTQPSPRAEHQGIVEQRNVDDEEGEEYSGP